MCLGYIDPYLTNAGRHGRRPRRIRRPLVVDHSSARTTGSSQTYVPILPKHIWED